MGFAVKKTSWEWSDNEILQLKQAIQNIAKNPQQIKVQNWHYHIAHNIFFGIIPVKAIKKKIFELLHTMNDVSNNNNNNNN